jgi:hypothetical protein
MGPTTFRTWFQEAGRDPYGGTYDRVMAAFEVPAAGTGWAPNRVLNSTLGAGDSYANAFVGLFPFHGEDAGRTRLVHTPLRFPSVMGRPTPYDNKAYVFLGDVVSGVASTVVYEATSFDLANRGAWTIPKDYPTALNAWASDLTVEVLDAMTFGADTRPVNVPRLMYVPPKYIPILLDRRLTPRQLLDELCGAISTDGKLAECAALVDWCIAAGVAETPGDTESPVLSQEVASPVGEAHFLAWRQATLHTMLPSIIGAGAGAAAAATTRMAHLMNDILVVQRDSRADALAARNAASAPKSPMAFFKPHVTAKLVAMCNVHDQHGLPDLWKEIASANGKRDRETIEMVLRDIANNLGQPELVPVVTPSLAKKLVSVRLAGTNLDDLSEGITPFAIVVMDHTTTTGASAYNEALSAAHDYDDLGRGTGADLSDLKEIKASERVVIPETFALARAMLQSFRIVLIAMLGPMHMEVKNYERFLITYTLATRGRHLGCDPPCAFCPAHYSSVAPGDLGIRGYHSRGFDPSSGF